MGYRAISDLLQEKAIAELNEEPLRIDEYLEHIQEWLRKQPHLTVRSDAQSLLTFLRGCKWSLQRTKEKIDYFYTMRTLVPEFFLDRDPLDELIQKYLRKGAVYPLPNLMGENGPQIVFFDYSILDFDEMPMVTFFKVLTMTIDLLLRENDHLVISGLVLLVNGTEMPLSYLLQFTPTLLKKFVFCFQHAYPIRIKNMIMFNAEPAITKIYNTICKPLFNEKLKSRIHLFVPKDFAKALHYVPHSLFPIEHGGNNGSCKELAEKWRVKVESCRKWFLEDSIYVSNEQLRLGKPKTYNEEFNIEGTFRKLNVD